MISNVDASPTSIDGVLVRSSDPIPGASKALRFLQKHKIPFILLTNGGGKTEKARIEDIASKLDVSLSSSAIVQSHTPFARLATRSSKPPSSPSLRENLKDKTILVAGGNYGKCREVAQEYGFTSVVTPGDIFAAHSEIWPFSRVFKDYYAKFAQPLPRPINPASPSNSLKIDAVFVYNDPRDWGLDIQLILDILLSQNGILGTYSKKNGDKSLPNNGYQQDGQPPLYFSNPDLLWAAAYPLSRLGQGGFRAALEGVWASLTHGAELKKHLIGKPYRETYEFAERRLMQHRASMFGEDINTNGNVLKRVYMVGDNPESDIAGANNYKSDEGVEWKSLLTRTGVYRDGEGRRPTHEPKAIVDDVKAAVQWALRDSNWHEELD